MTVQRVPGDGPLPSRIAFIAEAPGWNEMEQGKPMVGKSGKELNAHLERLGIPRSTVYVSNIVKTQPPVGRAGKQTAPTQAMIEADEPELVEELAACRPRWIGAIGRVAARRLAGVGDMESTHGMAFPLTGEWREKLKAKSVTALQIERTLLGLRPALRREWEVEPNDAWIDACRVVPVYHPAAALHNPELQPFVWHDLRTFAAYASGRLKPQTPVDAFTEPKYVDGLQRWGSGAAVVGVDTEGRPSNVWSVQVSGTPGTGHVVRHPAIPENRAAIQRIFDSADTLVLQFALHDEEILHAIGVKLDWSKVEDIFLMADVLRLVPRGLKAGVRRDCGMEMRSYSEVVAPAEKRLAREYVEAAIAARVCFECNGTSSVADREKIARRVAAALKSGKEPMYKYEPTRKCAACVDGGLWKPRAAEAWFDESDGLWKVRNGWEVQRYLRMLKADIDKGKYDTAAEAADGEAESEGDEAAADVDSPRRRFAGWPEEVQRQISGALGGGMPEPTLDDVPLNEAVRYAARDADGTLRRYPILKAQIDELGLAEAYRLDLDVMPVAAEIQRNGMHINRAYFAALVDELRDRKSNVAQDLEIRVGRPLNPGSPDQVAELLYGRMHMDYTDDDARDFDVLTYDLTPEKWTPSRKRGSVDEKTLEGIKLKYSANTELVETIDKILEWKMCDKIQQFAEKLPRYADARDRVHTRIKIGPATFRWASAQPNLQQIPTREKHGEELGKRVREGFDAPEGRVIGARDFDQIEMRVLAWVSQDATLLGAFRDGVDIHRLTASKVFRVQFADVTAAQRTSAKNIGFGIVYGVTARGLKAQMDLRGQKWTIEECQALIDSYLFEAYPGVGRFVLDAHAEARRYNMVRSLMGHIRYTPAVHSPNRGISEEALRQAANYKIQCTAAELLKIAERDLYRECGQRFRELDVLLMMSLHDELIVEAPDDPEVIEEVDALMAVYMTNPYPLDGIEITSGSKWAKTWGRIK